MISRTTGRRMRPIVAALLAGAMPFAAAHAQQRDLDRETSVGKVFSGEIADGAEAAEFLLTLQAGQAIDLTAAPVGGSDPKMSVYDARTGEVLAENDDSNGTLAASVRLFSERAQRVRIAVANAAVDADSVSGAMRFDLVLRPSAYRPRPVIEVGLGETHSGTLERSDEQLFRFTGEPGQLWTFSLIADEESGLDPLLEVFAGTRPAGTSLGRDDDGGEGLDSRLAFVVPQAGPYVVRASGVGQSSGAYVFSTERRQVAAPQAVAEVGFCDTVTGSIAAGSREHFYRLSEASRAAFAAAPGGLVLELRATGEGDLDPVVAVGFETPLGFSSVASDDDGGGGTNARLVLDASSLSEVWLDSLRIKVSGFLETSGAYELVVNPAASD